MLSSRNGIQVILLSVLVVAATCSTTSKHYESLETFFNSSEKHNVSQYLRLAKSAGIVGGDEAFTGTAIAFTNEVCRPSLCQLDARLLRRMHIISARTHVACSLDCISGIMKPLESIVQGTMQL